jgi:hypothetical protein
MAFENWNKLVKQCEKQISGKETKDKSNGTQTEHIETKGEY